MAYDTGPIATENQPPRQTLVAGLVGCGVWEVGRGVWVWGAVGVMWELGCGMCNAGCASWEAQDAGDALRCGMGVVKIWTVDVKDGGLRSL